MEAMTISSLLGRTIRNLGLLVALAQAAGTQVAPAPVTWTLATAEPARALRPGDRFAVTVRGEVERGWYVYDLTQPAGGPTALRITLPPGQPFATAGSVTGPEPKRAWDPAFEIQSAKHDGTASFTLPLRVAAGAGPGQATLQVQVRYQACSDTLCLRPKTETLSLPVDIRAGAAGSATPSREPRS